VPAFVPCTREHRRRGREAGGRSARARNVRARALDVLERGPASRSEVVTAGSDAEPRPVYACASDGRSVSVCSPRRSSTLGRGAASPPRVCCLSSGPCETWRVPCDVMRSRSFRVRGGPRRHRWHEPIRSGGLPLPLPLPLAVVAAAGATAGGARSAVRGSADRSASGVPLAVSVTGLPTKRLSFVGRSAFELASGAQLPGAGCSVFASCRGLPHAEVAPGASE